MKSVVLVRVLCCFMVHSDLVLSFKHVLSINPLPASYKVVALGLSARFISKCLLNLIESRKQFT